MDGLLVCTDLPSQTILSAQVWQCLKDVKKNVCEN